MLAPVLAAAAAPLLGGWFARPTVVCECRSVAHADERILDILREQLQRCGPERLAPTSADWGHYGLYVATSRGLFLRELFELLVLQLD